MSTQERERRGCVEQFQVDDRGGHRVHFDTTNDFAHLLQAAGSKVHGAEGGYLLIRFDVDDEPCSVVDVDPAAGWWPAEGKAPADLVYRGAEYLRLLAAKLEKFEELLDETS